VSDEPQSTTPAVPAAPKPTAARKTPNQQFVWGTGRRKTAVARVRIKPGEGKFIVNTREVDDFFRRDVDRDAVRKPLLLTDTLRSYDVFVNVGGGGITGQAGAIMLGLARALAATSSDYEPKLRENHLLTRDSRKVERKKYGQSGARRRFQFSKR